MTLWMLLYRYKTLLLWQYGEVYYYTYVAFNTTFMHKFRLILFAKKTEYATL
jgi:hypothetical protein